MIKDVWAHNLEQEMEVIRNTIDEYTCVSLVNWRNKNKKY
jgi:hypothetical protein